MRKLKLEIDTLAVESFAVARDADAARGTVRGAADVNLTLFYPQQCNSGGICFTYPTGCPCTPRAEI